MTKLTITDRLNSIGVRHQVLGAVDATPSKRDWSMATIPELVADIVATHHIPLRLELNRLGVAIDRLMIGNRHPAILELHKNYHDFKDTLISHLDQEEWDLFPLCIALEGAICGRHVWKNLNITPLVSFTSHGHAESERELHRIIGLLKAVMEICSDAVLMNIEDRLHAMVRDMVVHTAKEGDLLLPAAIFNEELLRTRHAMISTQVSGHHITQ